MLWRALSEDTPGPRWAGLFAEHWPAYKLWWLREGDTARPTYTECRRALDRHMPEILALYDELCELAGGSDHAARFLSFYCPPPYLSGAARPSGQAKSRFWSETTTTVRLPSIA